MMVSAKSQPRGGGKNKYLKNSERVRTDSEQPNIANTFID